MNRAIWNARKSLMLVFAVAVVTILTSAAPVKAQTKTAGTQTDYYKSEHDETATAGVEKKFQFKVLKDGTTIFCLVTDQASAMKITLYDSTGTPVTGIKNPYSVSGDRYVLVSDDTHMFADDSALPKGEYTCGITFEKDTTFAARVYRVAPEVSISQTRLELTAGYSQRLSVSGEKVKTWTSKNKSVAIVDKKGKVTGKNSGKTTVTATLVDGRKLTCSVIVRKNIYTDSKGTISEIPAGSVIAQAYRASLDSEGNLHVKVNVLNNTEKRITALSKMKVTVRDQKGRLVGYCKINKRNISVPAYSAKSTTFIIKKSDVKRTADLRNANVVCEGKFRATQYR